MNTLSKGSRYKGGRRRIDETSSCITARNTVVGRAKQRQAAPPLCFLRYGPREDRDHQIILGNPRIRRGSSRLFLAAARTREGRIRLQSNSRRPRALESTGKETLGSTPGRVFQ